ncbi:MAG: Methionyl-tRNA formyltransferase [Candidatus Adlerbacteria bacterium GW2011_GWA1_54_10]|uniref:methionyl-tRNA formyltransferase n=3 Tax=Candidatus Adleribacteriota TaxID=1752736 RepID=A0A0G1XXN9_9BACT|nr:MAG: Methionyl-tRNA formyltransferase [Candidatus Adlerbacteria bacterium GW2011_GWA1_54_10]KKW37912.1 MAG: Methionyl-tRNA formyltransferase [Candidatus Adlerbacteria bacterium GW2011_GWB1_54_7]
MACFMWTGRRKSMTNPKKKNNREILCAFFGSGAESGDALAQLQRLGLEPALVIRNKELPPEIYNTEWDVFVVASYGKILPKAVLDIPKHGCLNIHPSLLPKFRGPSPVLSAILGDERKTGVTIMQMNEEMDTGPIVAQASIEIDEEEWPQKGSLLTTMLFTEGANLLVEIMPQWIAGGIKPEPQNNSEATYTRKFTDEDARIDPRGDARAQFLKIMAFDKNPRAYFLDSRNRRIIVTDAEIKADKLEILKVIPEGKKEMPYADFLRGQK